MEENNDQQNDELRIGERIGFPACILRGVVDSAQTVTNIFMPQVYKSPLIKSEEKEPTEKQVVTDGLSGGLLNNKDLLHVLKDDTRLNVYTHRLSYNTLTDEYYENGNLDKEYLKTWKKGVLRCDNIYYKREHDWDKVYLARDPGESRDRPGKIYWKFDYSLGKFVISKLSLKLQHTIFDNDASVVWTVTALPSRANVNPIPQIIEFEPASSYPHSVDSRKDVTSLVEGQYGFVICASLSGGSYTNISWQRTQLFRRSTNYEFDEDSGVNSVDDDSGINFGLDVRVELIPDLICESLPEVEYSKEGKGKELALNDKETSDFVVHLEIPKDSRENEHAHVLSDKEVRDFYVHRNVLSARSDYFRALFDSHMIESRENTVTLSDISFGSLEMIFKFIYTGTLPDINSYDGWVELLHNASRFLIPTLVQRCEKGIREYLNDESVEAIEAVADECGANQLLRCCKMLKVEDDEEVKHDDKSTT